VTASQGTSSGAAAIRAVGAETRSTLLTASFNPSVAINLGFAQSDQGAPAVGGLASMPPIGSALSVNGVSAPDQRALSAYRGTLGNSNWVGELDRMREQVDNSIKVQSVMVGSSAAVTGTLSVGYVIWLLRGGLLLSSLLSSMPAWHAVDPMPVLARGGDSDDEDGFEEDPLEKLFGKARDALLGGLTGKGAAAEPAPTPLDPSRTGAQTQTEGTEVTA
jgi:hypothetical protein